MSLSDKDRTVISKMIKCCDDISRLMGLYNEDFYRYTSEISFEYSCGMCLIQIGELAGRVSEDVIRDNPSVAWRSIKAMRNIHAHDYGNIDYSIVWDTLMNDIPDLKLKLAEILKDRP